MQLINIFRNVDVYIEMNLEGVSVRGNGVYDLCGTPFRYKLSQDHNEITIMHSISIHSIHMLFIELSHPLNLFPPEIESVLIYKIKVVETLNISNPT